MCDFVRLDLAAANLGWLSGGGEMQVLRHPMVQWWPELHDRRVVVSSASKILGFELQTQIDRLIDGVVERPFE